MQLSLTYHPDGVDVPPGGIAVIYDINRGAAEFGSATVQGPALVWNVGRGDSQQGALVSSEVRFDKDGPLIIRCDRVDFPPGVIAHRHTHPGPGIRFMLVGHLTVETKGDSHSYGALEGWFEAGPDPVFATASESSPSAFVRVMLLPGEWEGRRTIQYVDPRDAEKPKLQVATMYFDRAIEL